MGATPRPPGSDGSKQQSVNALLSLLRTLGTNKQPQQQQQQQQQRVQQTPRPITVQASPRVASSVSSSSTYQAQNQPYQQPSRSFYQSNHSSYTGTLHDALQAQSQNNTPRQGYQAPPLPNVQLSTANRQAGPARVRFAASPSVAVISSSSANSAPSPAPIQITQQAKPTLSAAARSNNHVAQTNMQILQNMFKNTNSTASRRRQNALAGLLESIRSGKGISIGKPSQIRPSTSSTSSGKQADRNGQAADPPRKKRRMETPGTGRNRGLYYNLDPASRQSSAYSTVEENDELRSTADEDDEPVGRPFGPWLPSQIGPDGELLPRKRGRQRILTPEEALARRKERNRIAAQESRRKKAQQLSGTVRKVGELGGELEQTRVKYEELTKAHEELVQKYNDLENAHQTLKNDYDLLQDRQNQITNAIEMASRLGDDSEFPNEFSDEDDDEGHQDNGNEDGQGEDRRAGSVAEGDRGDNVISINGVDMNIDEYLAFSLAAAAAAQEDSMEQHAQEANEHMDGLHHDDSNHGTPFGNETSAGLDGDYHGSSANVEHGDNHGYMPLHLPPPNDMENPGESVNGDPSASIISALEKLNETHPTDGHALVSQSLNLPIEVDGTLAETLPAPQRTSEVAESHPLAETATSEGQEGRKRKRTDEDEDETNAAGAEEDATTPATMGEFDDDEDDGDFVPEFEIGWAGDATPGLAGDQVEGHASPAEDDLPAQTQDSIMAQPTQGAVHDVEEEDDEEEEEDDDEYFRIEEADYEDLFQPIEDVPIPVDDYQDIQAQYMQHLEEFNATMLREEMARRIADETAVGISMRVHHPPAASFPTTTDDLEAQRQAAQAYQDTLESLGIAPEASQPSQK
ncbi:hypothetical protein QFC22_005778 [Naganishia vaughanmartiniae]|uniref:Uncharacterized protein n=1 Tax=Naganishia vaughanmartiniae TaxID=1424756 RepID=A0ACC2WU40_9TREE|nr:hypothetical protein QFC22_005778 [Naganishia vaughanmartiniae]